MRGGIDHLHLVGRQRGHEQTPAVRRQRNVVGAQAADLQPPFEPARGDIERGDVTEVAARDV